ncbi:MAG: ABC transporter ATP-binding protein [Anaerolineaceae bacterium]|nr:ABC transporter ATP-binding protein [Anaerolineaceae bacterium]
MDPFIVCENLVKIYKVADLEVLALQGLDLQIEKGELVGIVGTSGSGKSTFLNVLGGLIQPSAGKIRVDGQDLLKATPGQLDSYRREKVGFIWQQPARNLLAYLTAQENVELPMTISGMGLREKQTYAGELLAAVGLWDHRRHKLAQLSGGQQQRVAIAVALANKPALLLGDEPTGELDSATADEILALFERLNSEYGLTTVIVTHDQQVARAVGRVITIRDGRTSSETVRRREVADSPAASFDEFVVVDNVGRLQIPPDLRNKTELGDRAIVSLTEEGHLLIKAVAERAGSVNGRHADSAMPDTAPPNRKRPWHFGKK